LDTYEEDFRKDLEKVCDRLNWSHYHVAYDGIHDELLFKGNFGITLELKAIKPNRFTHSVHNSFKPTQMPFYLNQIADSKTPTWIAVKYFEEKPTFGLYCLKSTKEIIDFFASKWKDIYDSNKKFATEYSLFTHLESRYGST
jgi:hypothetical protein